MYNTPSTAEVAMFNSRFNTTSDVAFANDDEYLFSAVGVAARLFVCPPCGCACVTVCACMGMLSLCYASCVSLPLGLSGLWYDRV